MEITSGIADELLDARDLAPDEAIGDLAALPGPSHVDLESLEKLFHLPHGGRRDVHNIALLPFIIYPDRNGAYHRLKPSSLRMGAEGYGHPTLHGRPKKLLVLLDFARSATSPSRW